ncbi:MAG: hypothetical protein FHK80_07235 [Azoarcus sp. PHD]|nr:MAG: hypothetical protein FHK80_07235 [Azoarcus sp. PHD]
MGRERTKNRVGGRFLALPHLVLDCPAFIGLSAPASRLLLDVARQFAGHNNGKLLCTLSALKPRGWTSNDTLSRARKELEAAKLMQKTREAMKPHRAAWFGLCWLPLDYDPLMDIKPSEFAVKQFLLIENAKCKKTLNRQTVS